MPQFDAPSGVRPLRGCTLGRGGMRSVGLANFRFRMHNYGYSAVVVVSAGAIAFSVAATLLMQRIATMK